MSGFNTRAIHVGSEPDPVTGAVNVPVFFTSTYAQDGVGRPRFSDYSRVDNPTRAALEECLAGLEGARHGVAFASGLAGEDALLRTLSPGDHVILGNDAYGGTFRLMTRSFTDWGLEISVVDQSDTDEVRAAFRPTTRMLWVETPSNPMLNVVSIAAIATSPTSTARAWWSTTPSPRPTCIKDGRAGALLYLPCLYPRPGQQTIAPSTEGRPDEMHPVS